MRGRLARRCLHVIALWIPFAGGSARAQTGTLPPAIDRIPPPRSATAPAQVPAGPEHARIVDAVCSGPDARPGRGGKASGRD